MWTLWALGTAAFGWDCGERLTAAHLTVPPWIQLVGGSVRFDHTLLCPEARGTSMALTVDLGASMLWQYHTGTWPVLRQQIGLHIEPAANGAVPGGPYLAPRLSVAEIFFDRETVPVVLPGVVGGYRFEDSSGFTAQFGAGLEGWISRWSLLPVVPVLDFRLGWAFGRAG